MACVDRPTEDIDGSRLLTHAWPLPSTTCRTRCQAGLAPPRLDRRNVLTPLARNAEAMVRRIEADTRGELIDQYPGGARGRAAQIEAGADRPRTS